MISLKECHNCGKEKPVWKRVSGRPYCQYCSKVLFGKKTTTQSKPIKKRSAKKISDDKAYSSLRKVFLTKHPVCMAHLPGCTQQATDIHHVKGRAGGFYLDTTTWVSLCRTCHTKVELNPELGRDIDMVKTRKS